MSKSLGNHIPITSSANDMYGKLMSIPDSSMPIYFRLVTRWTPEYIEKIEHEIEDGVLHPRDAKMLLASEVTSAFYSETDAEQAQQDFINTFQKNQVPDDLSVYILDNDKSCLHVLVNANLVKSRSQARNLIDQGAVRLDGDVISSWNVDLNPGVLQVGKRKFIRLAEK